MEKEKSIAERKSRSGAARKTGRLILPLHGVKLDRDRSIVGPLAVAAGPDSVYARERIIRKPMHIERHISALARHALWYMEVYVLMYMATVFEGRLTDCLILMTSLVI